MTCPACGNDAPEGARFCPSCGQPLQARADERRVATVLFADMVGFTTLSESRDPEQVKNLVDNCFERLVADVTAFGGRVDKIVGDAVVALFGAPVAHEDDAERAVRAALQMQQTLVGVTDELGVAVQLRIGVNTGEVLVGALRAGGDYTAMGDVVNVASRLQTLASPGQVVVGPLTYASTRTVISYEPLGSVQPKGRDEPVEAWAATAALAPPGRRPRRTPTPLVGRDHEMGMLRHAVATASARQRPQLVLLLGEAGIGKSRLAEEAAAAAATDFGAAVLEGRCVPYGEANVWWPVAEAIRDACDADLDDPPDVTNRKVRATAAATTGAEGEELDRLVDGLLYLLGGDTPLHNVEPGRARDEARRAVHAFIEGVATRRPLIVVLSELHWADPLVLDLIDDLFDRSRGLQVVLVATARPELEDRWMPKAGRHNSLVLHVDPLDAAAIDHLLESMLGERPPEDLRAVLLERSGGNPFFLEEMVALLAEAGVITQEDGRYRMGDLKGASDLPATLRGLVAARLDALSDEERATIEDAAVSGRAGLIPLLAALAEARGSTTNDAVIDELIRKDLIEVHGEEWSFRSDLVREVAYEILSKAERARRHSATAKWLEDRQKGRGRDDEDIDLIAHHYGTAAQLVLELGTIRGVPDDVRHRALQNIERAAVRAKENEMHALTVRLLDQAAELLPQEEHYHRRRLCLARARARAALHDLDQARADLETVLSDPEAANDPATMAAVLTVRGDIEQKDGNPQASIESLERAVELWRELDDEHSAADALRHLGFTKLMSGDPAGAEEPIAEALTAFSQLGDRRGEAWAQQNLAWIAFASGDLRTAEDRLQTSIATFAEIGDHGGKGWALGLLGFVRYFEGRLEEAGHIAESIVADGRERGDRWALAMTLVLTASVRLWRGQALSAIDPAREALALFREIGDAAGEQMALAPLSRALIASGSIAEGQRVVTMQRQSDTRYGGPQNFAGLLPAAVAIQVGDPEAALRLLGISEDVFSVEGVVGDGEQATALGLASLQLGHAEESVARLINAEHVAHGAGELANARATLALASTAAGHATDALDVLARFDEADDGTYLDRAIAATAQGFAFMQLAQRPEAERAFAKALATVDRTDDRLAQALLRLAYGRALQGIGDEGAAEVLSDAHSRLDAMDLAVKGWDTAFRLAANASAPAQA